MALAYSVAITDFFSSIPLRGDHVTASRILPVIFSSFSIFLFLFFIFHFTVFRFLESHFGQIPMPTWREESLMTSSTSWSWQGVYFWVSLHMSRNFFFAQLDFLTFFLLLFGSCEHQGGYSATRSFPPETTPETLSPLLIFLLRLINDVIAWFLSKSPKYPSVCVFFSSSIESSERSQG